MGRKSTKENKTLYQVAREDLGLTREAAEDLLEYITADRLEKIESQKLLARPEEVVHMAEKYKRPELCNYYCSHECPIGEKYVPEVESKDIAQITLEMLATLSSLEKTKDRLVEITVDGVITEDEKPDFMQIKNKLEDMAKTIDSLTLWVENAMNNGKIE